MADSKHGEPQVVPFRSRWHLIDEIDLAPLLAAQSSLWNMCRELEAVADRLGEPPPLAERRSLAISVLDRVRAYVWITRPVIARMAIPASAAFGRGIVLRLLQTQVADENHAEDVAEALGVEQLDGAGAERLGYMLRCLFDGCRRALDLQTLALLTLDGGYLTAGARLALEHASARRYDPC